MKKGSAVSIGMLLVCAGACQAQDVLPVTVSVTPEYGVTQLAEPSTSPVPAPLFPSECPPIADRLWFSGEYLLWWFKKTSEPVQLVTSTDIGAASTQASAGIPPGSLGAQGTGVALGGNGINTEERSGARFTLGGWLDPNRTIGLEAGGFFIAPKRVSNTVGSLGGPTEPILTVPFFDVLGTTTGGNPRESAGPVLLPAVGINFPFTLPGQIGTRFTETLESKMAGFEINGFSREDLLGAHGGLKLQLFGGFRYLNVNESLAFSTSSFGLAGTQFESLILNTTDGFNARNDFYGCQIGARGQFQLDDVLCGLSIKVAGKVAIGDMHEQITISGNTQTNLSTGQFTPVASFPGGIFAQPTNIGQFSRDRFAVVPEADLNVSYKISSWAQISLGYSFLYVNNVAQPGELINHNLNVSQIPLNNVLPGSTTPSAVSPPQPTFGFRDSSFWAQGISFGVEFRY